jgi:hypothetical protein
MNEKNEDEKERERERETRPAIHAHGHAEKKVKGMVKGCIWPDITRNDCAIPSS